MGSRGVRAATCIYLVLTRCSADLVAISRSCWSAMRGSSGRANFGGQSAQPPRDGVGAGEAAKLRPSPDAVRGTAQPEVTPAGHRVQGPGYGQKPRTRGCDAAKQLTQGHLRASWRQLRLRCRQLRLSQSPVRSLRLRGKRPVLLMSSLAVCCGSGVHSPHDAAAWWAPAEGSEMARSPFRESTRGQGSIQHHRKLCLR